MFELPFYLRNVLQGVVAGFVVSGTCIAVVLLCDRRVWKFRQVIDLLLALRMHSIDEAKRYRVFRKVLLGMAVFFVAMALFYAAVYVGIIQNGQPRKPPTVDQFIQDQLRKGPGE